MVSIAEIRPGRKTSGVVGLAELQLRSMSEVVFYQIFYLIHKWANVENPHIGGSDEVRSFQDTIKLLVGEIKEASESFEELLVFWGTLQVKTSLGIFLKKDLSEYRQMIKEFENEMVDVLVFWVNLVEKYHKELTPVLEIDISGSILSANGQSMDKQIFVELANIARAIDSKNIANQLQYFLKTFISYTNHLPISIDILQAVKRKLGVNKANRTFGRASLTDRNGNPLSVEVRKWRYDVDELLSKKLRKLFSGMLDCDVSPLMDWMKKPFTDLFDYEAFSNLGDLEVAIYECFIAFFTAKGWGDKARRVVKSTIEDYVDSGKADQKVVAYFIKSK